MKRSKAEQDTKWLLLQKNGCRWELGGTVQSLKKRRSEGGVDDGKRESSQSVYQSLQAWPLSRGLCSGRDHRPAATLKPSQAHSDR